MNIKNRVEIHHYVNVALTIVGIVWSLYIVGWVKADNNVLIGTFGFFVLLCLLCSTVINHNMTKAENKSKDN